MEVDIGDLLPASFDRTGMCSKGYHDFEKRVRIYLESQGWKFPKDPKMVERCGLRLAYYGGFISTDSDSFGPLVRMAFDVVRPDGSIVDIVHG